MEKVLVWMGFGVLFPSLSSQQTE